MRASRAAACTEPRTADGVTITDASGPGESDRYWDRMHLSWRYVDVFEDAVRGTGSTCVGIWHSHPEGDSGEPSDADIAMFASGLRHYRADAFYGLIYTTEAGAVYPGLDAWVVRDDDNREIWEPCRLIREEWRSKL
jgi:proteasome lid subunit RPN8/RPN11